jgi:hypothetical protein
MKQHGLLLEWDQSITWARRCTYWVQWITPSIKSGHSRQISHQLFVFVSDSFYNWIEVICMLVHCSCIVILTLYICILLYHIYGDMWCWNYRKKWWLTLVWLIRIEYSRTGLLHMIDGNLKWRSFYSGSKIRTLTRHWYSSHMASSECECLVPILFCLLHVDFS